MRNRRTPVQPIGTGRRAFIRSAFGTNASGWAALSAADQAAWIGYANDHPVVDRLGQSIKLTGQQMYVAVNTQLLNCGSAVVSAVPASSAVWTPGPASMTAASGTPSVSVIYTAGSAGDFLNIAFSSQQSAGRTFNSNWWQATSIDAATASPYDGTSAYTAQFGTLSSGLKIFCKLTPVNQYGVTGVPVVVNAIIT